MLKHLDVFCQKLVERSNGHEQSVWTEPRDMDSYDKWLALDTMGEIGFGKKMGLLESSEHRFIIDIMHFYSWMMGFYEQLPGLAKLRLEDSFQIGRRLLRFDTTMEDKWETWKKDFSASVFDSKKPKNRSLFSSVIEASTRNHGRKFAMSELWAEGCFLMLAGSDTSATTISALFFYLAHNANVLQRLQSEIRETFANTEAIRLGQQLSSCIYLQACINETLRMSPSTPGAPWREAQEGGAVVDGDFVPAGYDVGTCIYAIHHCERYFPNAHAFTPERWIAGGLVSPEQLEVAYQAFNPFSLGPRGCPGRSFALLEISLTLARVVFDFDFRLADGGRGHIGEGTPGLGSGRHRADEFQLWAHVTASSKGPELQFRRRNSVFSANHNEILRYESFLNTFTMMMMMMTISTCNPRAPPMHELNLWFITTPSGRPELSGIDKQAATASARLNRAPTGILQESWEWWEEARLELEKPGGPLGKQKHSAATRNGLCPRGPAPYPSS
ncbi:MAG: hypothetical protein Q9187_005578 [Circinaria calcarea]